MFSRAFSRSRQLSCSGGSLWRGTPWVRRGHVRFCYCTFYFTGRRVYNVPVLKLTGKTAVVTGSSSRNRAGDRDAARQGGRADRSCRSDAGALAQAVLAIEEGGGTAAAIPLDLRIPDAPARLGDFAREKFDRIDIVVNNAGATKRGEFADLTELDWSDGFALKFFCMVRLTRAAWPHLKANSGSVINISGIGGRTPGAHFTIGGSVNAAMLSFTKAIAETGLRDDVQVNAISPGDRPDSALRGAAGSLRRGGECHQGGRRAALRAE